MKARNGVHAPLLRVQSSLYAARQQESLLAAESHHPGTQLGVEECQQKVDTLLMYD
jgi:hypothetical protein